MDNQADKTSRQDVQNQRNESVAFEAHQNFLKVLLDTIQVGIVACDGDGVLRLFNPASRHMHGLSEEPILPDQWAEYYDLYMPDGKTMMSKEDIPLYRAFQGEYLCDEGMVIVPKGKTPRIVLVTGQPLYTEDGQKIGAVVAMHDITEWKEMEDKLHKEQKFLKALLDNIQEGIVACNADGVLNLFNLAARKMHGSSEKPILPDQWAEYYDFYMPDGKTMMSKEDIPLYRALQGEYLKNVEMMIIPKDGKARTLLAGGQPLLTDKKEQIGAIVSMHDITEKKKAEEVMASCLKLHGMLDEESGDILQFALEESERLTESKMGYFHFVDEDQETISLETWSKAARESCFVKGVKAHYPISQAGVWVDCVRQRRPVIHNDYSGLPDKKGYPQGHVQVVRDLAVPVFEDGKIVLIVGVGNKPHDYTQEDIDWVGVLARTVWSILRRKKAEEELYALNEQLEQRVCDRTADLKAKNEEMERFNYTVSHDLKSPLVTIHGFLGIMEEDLLVGDIQRVKEDIEIIKTAAQKMNHLLNDLLELSRIGKRRNPQEEIALTGLVGETLVLLQGELGDNLDCVNVADDLPVVHGERSRLIEVFQNLISNAFKYMGDQPNPQVTIGLRQQADLPVIYVQDNGIGIKESDQKKVFDLFEQLDASVEGSGVGLALVKRIIEVHNGRIWIESDGQGNGSTFCFTLGQE